MTDRAFTDSMSTAAMTTESTDPLYRLKFEDADLDDLLGDCDVYTSRAEVFAAFAAAVAAPPADAGSVYLTEDDGEDEIVVAGHYFVDVATSG